MTRSADVSRSDIEHLRRVHVNAATYWDTTVGTDYWFVAGAAGNTASKPATLADWGWTTTSLVVTAGSGADFLAPTDYGTPANWSSDAAADALASPAIFGDYMHAHMASEMLGQKTLPRYLVCDIFGAISTDSGNETKSGFGLSTSTVGTDANKAAFIFTDGTNFLLRSSAATSSATGATAVDTNYHNFRIVLDGFSVGALAASGTNASGGAQLARWFIDGVAQPTIALKTDTYPVQFEAYADTTNRFNLSKVHIFYAYKLPAAQPMAV